MSRNHVVRFVRRASVIAAWYPVKPPIQSTPKCFASRRQFERWIELYRPREMPASGFCVACTPEYKGRMLKEGRCHFPDTTWEEDEDFVEGDKQDPLCMRVRGVRMIRNERDEVCSAEWLHRTESKKLRRAA